MGAARSALESARTYAMEREQFGKPIAAFQLTQQKLANMSVEYVKGVLAAHLVVQRTTRQAQGRWPRQRDRHQLRQAQQRP